MLYHYFTPPHENDKAAVDDWWVHITSQEETLSRIKLM